jgi:hypothetical protein
MEKLDLFERKMQALLLPSFDKHNSSAPDEEAAKVNVQNHRKRKRASYLSHIHTHTHTHTHKYIQAVGYLVSTLASELEAGQLHSLEDVFGIVQVSIYIYR